MIFRSLKAFLKVFLSRIHSQIRLVILLTLEHTILIMLVRKI